MTSLRLSLLLGLIRSLSAIRSAHFAFSNVTADTSFGQNHYTNGTATKILASGWALRCSQACNPRGEPGTIAKLDELDTRSVFLVYILFRQDQKWYKVKYCSFGKLGTCNVKERLSQASHLISLPLGHEEGSRNILTFRGSVVKSFADITAKLQTEFTSDGTYFSWLVGSPTEWLAQKALAESFIQTFALQQTALLAKEKEFQDEFFNWIGEQWIRSTQEEKLRSRLAQAVPLLSRLRSTIFSRLRTLPHHVYKCGIKLSGEALNEAEQQRMELDRSRGEHRKEQQESLKDLAFQTFNVVFATLAVVADASLPLSGSIANIAQQATSGAATVVRTFAEPEFISTLVTASQQLQTVSSGALPDITAIVPTDLQSAELLEVSAATDAGAMDEAINQLKDKIKEIAEEGKEVTRNELFEAAKAILWSAMKAGATEGAWTAASYVPIIGPYVNLARSLIDLKDMALDTHSSHVAYLRHKDPIIRSLFRLRDCQLAILMETPIEEVRISSKPLELQEAAIRTAIDAGLIALNLNQDLVQRLCKTSFFGSQGKHEKSVMCRLDSGQTKWYVGTRIEITEGNDAYLPADEIRPSDWQEQFEQLISDSKTSIDHTLAERS